MGRGGEGQEPWVEVLRCPEYFHEPKPAEFHAKAVARACASGQIGALIVESGMSVAGVVLPPPGYLHKA